LEQGADGDGEREAGHDRPEQGSAVEIEDKRPAASSARLSMSAAAKAMRGLIGAVQHANCDLAKAGQIPRSLGLT
jgi:hypothetical protein